MLVASALPSLVLLHSPAAHRFPPQPPGAALHSLILVAPAFLTPEQLEPEIRSTGFYRNKAKSIVGAAKKITADYAGNVPDSMDALLTLPGVARKTANVVLGVWFKQAAGVVVDTHVTRISQRLQLTKHEAPEKIEADLMALIPQDTAARSAGLGPTGAPVRREHKRDAGQSTAGARANEWIAFSHQVIAHGRQCCIARQPQCQACPIETLCRAKDKTWSSA